MVRTLWLLAVLAGIAVADVRVPTGPRLQVAYSYDSSAARMTEQGLRSELDTILTSTGVSLHWLDLSKAPLVDFQAPLVFVRFRGACDSAAASRSAAGRALGTTAVRHGDTQNTIIVDCGRIRDLLHPELGTIEPHLRPHYLGKAFARVLAHELRHALSGKHDHEEQGLAKARLSARDLLWGAFTLEADDLHRPSRASLEYTGPESFPAPDEVSSAPSVSDDLEFHGR